MLDRWILLHTGALGDLVLALQLALRAAPPAGARLNVLSRSDPGDLSSCSPAIVRRSLEGLSAHWLFAEDDDPPADALRGAIAGRIVLNAMTSEGGPVHRRLQVCGAAAVYSYDPRPRDGTAHITAQWQRDLERQGLLLRKCVYTGREGASITPDDGLIRRGRALLRETGLDADSCGLIHPGSGGRAKCWTQDGFIAVGRQLRGAGHRVLFIVGPVEQERWSAQQRARLTAEFPLCAPGDSTDLAALLSAGEVLIGNDSGPAHLAAFLGVPTVTLFGPTRRETWRPLGPRSVAVQGAPDAGADWGLDAAAISDAALRCAAAAG